MDANMLTKEHYATRKWKLFPNPDGKHKMGPVNQYHCGICFLIEKEYDYVGRFCWFCREEGEPFCVVISHNFFSEKQNQCTCPRFSKTKCSICGATGLLAHQIKFCPVKVRENRALKEHQQLMINMMVRDLGLEKKPEDELKQREKREKREKRRQQEVKKPETITLFNKQVVDSQRSFMRCISAHERDIVHYMLKTLNLE